MRILAVIGVGVSCLLLAADEPEEKVRMSSTERMDFPPGGTLRLRNSTGALTVEGWEQPYVEITTIKSTKVAYDARERGSAMHELDRVRVTAGRRGDELVVTTDYPRHRIVFLPPLPYSLAEKVSFDLEYRIKAPRTARLVAEHDAGEVNVDGLSGDIDVTLRQGEVLLHLSEEGQYDIHAESDIGNVKSDFPGQEKPRRGLFGHRVVNGNSIAAHKLNLKVGFGDIVILKTRTPTPPEPLGPAAKQEGL